MDYPLLHSVRSTCLSGDFPLPITVGLCFSMLFFLFKLTVSFLNPSYKCVVPLHFGIENLES